MKRVIFLILLAAASCRDQQPPAPTQEQSQQLNEAEDMLNAVGTNEKGPEDHSPGPSNSSD